ncbi:MAG TPA: acyl-CoA dehydrogenase family protein, partial [Burkholderiaceae bacterium]|nr:acyl-CoA dehydrogenase family protein [Burkholderiaceae bacterium]
MLPSLLHCLQAPVEAESVESATEWVQHWRGWAAEGWPAFELALRAGFAADRVAWAFAGGYQAALRAMAPAIADGVIVTLCATEQGGNQPRDIQTTVTPDGAAVRLNGRKRWSTLAPVASHLLVVAIDGSDEARAAAAAKGHPVLRLVRVATSTPGVLIQTMAATAFAPEVPHAEIELQAIGVTRGDVLPGDGFAQYLKPFRTAEDLFVNAACLAYLIREARAHRWPSALIEAQLSALCALGALSGQPFDSPAVHLSLAGTLDAAARIYEAVDALWPDASSSAPAERRWRRDRALFGVASSARAQRTARAWSALS